MRVLSRGLAALGCAICLCAVPVVAFGEPGVVERDPEISKRTEYRGSWRYSTYYLFPLTRHAEKAGIPYWGRMVLLPLTAGVDLAQLPFGAIGGLLGD